jgi:hypothetical protein
LIAITGSGCFLTNREDAIEKLSQKTVDALSQEEGSSSSQGTVAPQFIEKQSSLARSSGQSTWVRLRALFPGQDQGILKESDFAFEGAPGIFRSLGSASRQFEPVSQIALRQKVVALCHNHLQVSRLFTWVGHSAEEQAPADPVDRTVLAAARNGWLHPFDINDKAVQELKRLYVESSKLPNNEGVRVAPSEKAVCIAVFLAPQFWLGTAKKSDVARRISLELFLRVPSIAELAEFEKAQTSPVDYFNRLLADETAAAGLKKNIHQWHEQWLGLRTFISKGMEHLDRRSHGNGGSNSVGGPYRMNQPHATTGRSRSVALGIDRVESMLAANFKVPQVVTTSCQDKAQEFDPETLFTYFEHRDITQNRWNFTGGWVKWTEAARAAFADNLFSQNGLAGSVAPLLCGEGTTAAPRFEIDDQLETGVKWRRCNGLVALNGVSGNSSPIERLVTSIQMARTATAETALNPTQQQDRAMNFVNMVRRVRIFQTSTWSELPHIGSNLQAIKDGAEALNWLNGTHSPSLDSSINALYTLIRTTTSRVFFEVSLTDYHHNYDAIPQAPSQPSSLNAYAWGNLSYFTSMRPSPDSAKLPIYSFGEQDRRHRRYAPSGWQDGLSKVKLWFSGAEVAVCNSFDRFVASCFFRPSPYLKAVSRTLQMGTGLASVSSDLVFFGDSGLNPVALGSMRCGVPNEEALASGDYNLEKPNEHYPRGTRLVDIYDRFQAQLVGASVADGALASEQKINREITEQLHREPYHLIDEIVFKDRDYRSLLTAAETYGTDCLEEYYSEQAFFLPKKDPTGCRAGGPVRKLNPGKPIKTALLVRPDGAIQGIPLQLRDVWDQDGVKKANERHLREIPPRTLSGILTMPAFMSPVQNSARGIASRYFSRLLCDEPSFFDTEQAGVDNLHRPLVSGREHLRPECYNCHRNLDPLASALSWRFISLGPKLGEGAFLDFLGEIGQVALHLTDRALGIRHGGSIEGRGAFMGKEVIGVRGLGQAIADSRKFAECTVSTTFRHVYGRPVQFSDIKLFEELTNRFISPDFNNYRYLDLLRTMITSKSFQRAN